MVVQEKYNSCYMILTDQISLPLPFKILGSMCIVIIFFPVCGVSNFETNLSYQAVFLAEQNKKFGTKI